MKIYFLIFILIEIYCIKTFYCLSNTNYSCKSNSLSITPVISTIYSTLVIPSIPIYGEYVCNSYYANNILFATFHYTSIRVTMPYCKGIVDNSDPTQLICRDNDPFELIVFCNGTSNKSREQIIIIENDIFQFPISIYCKKYF